MPRSYSRDLRERLVQARASRLSATEIARTAGVSARSVRRWTRLDAAGQTLEPGRTRRIATTQDDQLRAQVAATPDATLAEHCARWAETTTEVASARRDEPGPAAAVAAAQQKIVIATEQHLIARAQWTDETVDWAAERVVFLDETSPQTVMTRARGRARRGARVVGGVPRNHGPTITCLAALSTTGIRAPLVFPGALDGAIFGQWLRDRLLPTLPPGTTIVLDNLSVHRNAAARAAIAEAGCQLRVLPASSPDFHPIELVFAKRKTHLRGAASRDDETLVSAIGAGFDGISAADAVAWYRHCGYPLAGSSPGQPPFETL